MASGLYERGIGSDREELRLDVDGLYPQRCASGTSISGGAIQLHWVAGPLTSSVVGGVETWSGPMWRSWGPPGASMPYSQISLSVSGTTLKAVLTGPGVSVERNYEFRSVFFRAVELEYDVVDGVTAPLTYQTDSHSDRPADLTAESITVDELFRRAGFHVTRNSGDSTVPTSVSGADGTWSNAELHDAMMAHWSRSQADKARPGWALWTIFADRHDDGFDLGGVMFDSSTESIDTYDFGIERQGTAVFINSFISQAPAGEASAAAWVRRMQFWCAVHEMGHAFNLLHAWQKGMNNQSNIFPWIPEVTDGAKLLTFMNYPYFYDEGADRAERVVNFFRKFPFSFTHDEMLFMRHAPEAFVQMGGETFGRNHALRNYRESDPASLKLVVRANKGEPVFDYLEPITLELKLSNVSDRPVTIDSTLLRNGEGATILIGKNGRPFRAWEPHLHACYQPGETVLAPGESVYGSVFISSGKNGWDIADPGYYSVQAALQHGDYDVVSNSLRVRILPPLDRKEEVIAQDFFTTSVGRVLAMDGSRFLTKANDVLKEIATKFSKTAAAVHAKIALGMPGVRSFKEVSRDGRKTKVTVHPATAESAKFLAPIFTDPAQANRAAATLGHIDFKDYGTKFCVESAHRGKEKVVKDAQSTLVSTLKKRKVLNSVIQDVQAQVAEADPEKTGRSESGMDKPRRSGGRTSRRK